MEYNLSSNHICKVVKHYLTSYSLTKASKQGLGTISLTYNNGCWTIMDRGS